MQSTICSSVSAGQHCPTDTQVSARCRSLNEGTYPLRGPDLDWKLGHMLHEAQVIATVSLNDKKYCRLINDTSWMVGKDREGVELDHRLRCRLNNPASVPAPSVRRFSATSTGINQEHGYYAQDTISRDQDWDHEVRIHNEDIDAASLSSIRNSVHRTGRPAARTQYHENDMQNAYDAEDIALGLSHETSRLNLDSHDSEDDQVPQRRTMRSRDVDDQSNDDNSTIPKQSTRDTGHRHNSRHTRRVRVRGERRRGSPAPDTEDDNAGTRIAYRQHRRDETLPEEEWPESAYYGIDPRTNRERGALEWELFGHPQSGLQPMTQPWPQPVTQPWTQRYPPPWPQPRSPGC
jgi:hypothetical protein